MFNPGNSTVKRVSFPDNIAKRAVLATNCLGLFGQSFVPAPVHSW